MIHRGPFQPLPFCDSVILWWMPLPWKCSRPGWMGLWETWSSGRCACPRRRGWN